MAKRENLLAEVIARVNTNGDREHLTRLLTPLLDRLDLETLDQALSRAVESGAHRRVMTSPAVAAGRRKWAAAVARTRANLEQSLRAAIKLYTDPQGDARGPAVERFKSLLAWLQRDDLILSDQAMSAHRRPRGNPPRNLEPIYDELKRAGVTPKALRTQVLQILHALPAPPHLIRRTSR